MLFWLGRIDKQSLQLVVASQIKIAFINDYLQRSFIVVKTHISFLLASKEHKNIITIMEDSIFLECWNALITTLYFLMHKPSTIQQTRIHYLLHSLMSGYYLDSEIQSILGLMEIMNIDFQQSAKLLEENNWNTERFMNNSQMRKNLYAKGENEIDRSMSEQQNTEYFKIEQSYKKRVKQQEQREKRQEEEKEIEQQREQTYQKDAEYFNNYKEDHDTFTFLIRTAAKNITKSFNKHQKVSIVFKYVNGCLRNLFENKNSEFDIKFRSCQTLQSLSSFKQQRLTDLFDDQSNGEVLIIHEF